MAEEECAVKFTESKLIYFKKTGFYLKILLLILTLICSECFHMTKIIRARNVKRAHNIVPKSWSQISGPGPVFWVWNM